MAEISPEKLLGRIADGKPVAHAVTRPYGCGIKYGSG